jgi:hypothetical protein
MKRATPVKKTIIRRAGRTHFEGKLFESPVKSVAVIADAASDKTLADSFAKLAEVAAAHLTQATLPDVVCKRCLHTFKAKDLSAEGFCSRCAYQNELDLRIHQRLIPQVKTIGGTLPPSGAMWDTP